MNARQSAIRVCRIVSDYPVGGKSSYGLQPVFYNLSREQAKMGHDVHVIARKYEHQPSEEANEGVHIHRVGNPFTLNAIRALEGLTKNQDHMSTVIHTHATAGVFMAVLKRALKAPLVSHVHGTSRSAFMPTVLRFGEVTLGYSRSKVAVSYLRERRLWSSADGIAAVCESVRQDLISYYGLQPERITAVYNGVDTSIFRPIPGAKIPGHPELEGKRIVLYVGHFGLRKGLFYLIKAMRKVCNEVPDSVLVCVGGVPRWLGQVDYWKMLNEFIRTNDLDGRIILMDKVPNDKLPLYYSSSVVSVLPSYYEAFPKVVIEAMACGKPVVATKDGGPEEALGNEVAGLLVRYGSSSDLSSAIVRILQDQSLGRRMGNAGRGRVESEYTWPKVADRTNMIYERVTN